MKKIILIIGLILLGISCSKSDNLPLNEEQSIDQKNEQILQKSNFKKFSPEALYNLVRYPVSGNFLKEKLKSEGIDFQPIGKLQDFSFIISDPTSVYPNYLVEVQIGEVLVNFNKPTSQDIRADYTQNVIIYPLNESKEFVKGEQPAEKAKALFDDFREMIQAQYADYQSNFRATDYFESLFGNSGLNISYEEFVERFTQHKKDCIAIWKPDFELEITSENSSELKNLPIVEMRYYEANQPHPLPNNAAYRITIKANLPKDMKKLIFDL